MTAKPSQSDEPGCCDTGKPGDTPRQTDPGPGNEGAEWARRNSETGVANQGNRQPERRGAQSPAGDAPTDEDDTPPEWRGNNDVSEIAPRLTATGRP